MPQEVVVHPEGPTLTAIEVSSSVASQGPNVVDAAVVEEHHGVAAVIFMELNYVPSLCPFRCTKSWPLRSLLLIP